MEACPSLKVLFVLFGLVDVINGHVSHMILSFTTVITTVTMILNYSHVVPQDI